MYIFSQTFQVDEWMDQIGEANYILIGIFSTGKAILGICIAWGVYRYLLHTYKHELEHMYVAHSALIDILNRPVGIFQALP